MKGKRNNSGSTDEFSGYFRLVQRYLDDKWWIGCVFPAEEGNDLVKLMFLHPSGQARCHIYSKT